MRWRRKYDDAVLGLIRSGVGSVSAIRSELKIPAGTVKRVLPRLVASGQVRVVERGWYAPCR